MKVKDLKLALDQYDDSALVNVALGLGTINRINHGEIEEIGITEQYFVKYAKKDPESQSMVLYIE